MNYEAFLKELEENIFSSQEFTGDGTVLRIHLRGEQAEPGDADTDHFIKNTNMKYFKSESSTLLGDFAELNIPCRTDDDKTNFIRFDIKYLYDLFCSYGWESVKSHIDSNISYAGRIEEKAGNIFNSLDSYGKIRDKLIIRPLSLKYNKAQLEEFVYKTVGDIALVLYAVVLDDSENNCLNTIKIPKQIFEKWNIDKDTLFLSTLLNTNVYAMPRMYTSLLNFESTPESESAFMSVDSTAGHLRAETIPLVTTTRKTNGAVAMFYPGVKEKIAEMFGDSFYVAFTSIHEAMLHKKGTFDPSSIRRHVRATNKAFGPEETLSDNVYFYDMNTKTFSIVTE